MGEHDAYADRRVKRFKYEAKVMAREEKDNPYIVPVLDFWADTERGPAIIMQKMDSEEQPNLETLSAKMVIPLEEIVCIMYGVAHVSDEMWKKYGIVHR